MWPFKRQEQDQIWTNEEKLDVALSRLATLEIAFEEIVKNYQAVNGAIQRIERREYRWIEKANEKDVEVSAASLLAAARTKTPPTGDDGDVTGDEEESWRPSFV